MLLLAAAAVVSLPPLSPAAATASATATIRIVRAVKISFGGPASPDVPPPRDVEVRLPNGANQSIKVVEFE